MPSSRVYPLDILSDIKNKLRLVQDLLCNLHPQKNIELSSMGATGLYLILEDAQDDLLKAMELLEAA